MAVEALPGSDVRHRGDDQPEKSQSRENRHDDGDGKIAAVKSRAGFFGGLADGFETGHQPGNDLPDEQDGDERRVTEDGVQIGCAAVLCSGQGEPDDEREKSEGGEFQKASAGMDAAIIQPSKEEGDCEAKSKMRQVDRMISNPVKLNR